MSQESSNRARERPSWETSGDAGVSLENGEYHEVTSSRRRSGSRLKTVRTSTPSPSTASWEVSPPSFSHKEIFDLNPISSPDDEEEDFETTPRPRKRKSKSKKKKRKSRQSTTVRTIILTSTVGPTLQDSAEAAINPYRVSIDNPFTYQTVRHQNQFNQQQQQHQENQQRDHNSILQPSFQSFSTSLTPALHAASFAETTPLLNLPPKSTITVTTIASWTRVFPIKHGFKTSYATVTTSGFNTTLIKPENYHVTLHPSDTKQLLTYLTKIEGAKAQVLVTTTTFSEIKLVPIRVGFSTRTDTLTKSIVLTGLTTLANPIINTASVETLKDGEVKKFETVTSVTTETLTTTSLSSLVLDGKLLLSPVSSTFLKEATVTKTKTIETLASTVVPTTITTIEPSLVFTTLVTFQITGSDQRITQVITPVTLPLNSMNTRVKRHVNEEEEMLASSSSPSLSHALIASSLPAVVVAASSKASPAYDAYDASASFDASSFASFSAFPSSRNIFVL